MADEVFDRDSWERRWAQALKQNPDAVASRPPNAHFLAEVADLAPGVALDAGCGHGAEAIWLAAAGWQVTAVDFSMTALEQARSTAQAIGEDVARRVDWVEGDLGIWVPPQRRFDLVSCLYVHVAGSVAEMVNRLATGVAPGGTLLLVGHQPVDPETGEPTPAAGQVQVSVDDAVEGLDARVWQIVLAEERRRARAGDGVDAYGPRTSRRGSYGGSTGLAEGSKRMTFGEAISSVLSKYATFSGRARRSEYWYWLVAIVVANIAVAAIYAASDTAGIVAYLVLALAVLLPSIAVAIRRLHDINRTGWWVLISFIPFGGIVLLIFSLLEGTPGDNKYGPSPKAI